MRRRIALLLVVVVVVTGFTAGFMRPAKASTVPTKVQPSKANVALVCLWVPVLNVGLC